MNINKFILLFILFSLSSCSFFINKIDDDLLNKQTESYKKENIVQTYCKKNISFELINDNSRSQKTFLKFMLETQSEKKLSFIDKAVLWSLVQMNLRPDMSSPTSKIQFLIKKNGKDYYYHIFTKNKKGGYPYLYAMEFLLKKFRSKFSLYQLASLLDTSYPNRYYVSSNFANFLQQNVTQLKSNKYLTRSYMRGDETLRENERIRKQKLTPIIKEFQRTKKNTKYEVSNYLFKYKRNNFISAKCNYDMGLYSSSIYLIHDKVITSNTFGLRSAGQSFLADSTQALGNTISPLSKTIFLQGKSQTRSTGMCSFSFPLKKNKDLWLVSSESRDPGQHLFHLMEYGLHDIKNKKEIDNLLRFSRHLFLKNPVRLILESEKSSPEQLNELLKLSIPIYNSERLGRIWGFYKNSQSKTFITDKRRSGSLSCNTSR